MDIKVIFGLQLVLSLALVALLARWFLSPWLRTKTQDQALFWLTLPHATRHIGLAFLVPGVVSTSLQPAFAGMAGYGDLVAGVLAMLVLVALRNRWTGAIGLVWIFNVAGTLDLLNALRHAEAIPHLGAAWFIPTFWVPVLLVTHIMSFARLLRRHSVGARCRVESSPVEGALSA